MLWPHCCSINGPAGDLRALINLCIWSLAWLTPSNSNPPKSVTWGRKLGVAYFCFNTTESYSLFYAQTSIRRRSKRKKSTSISKQFPPPSIIYVTSVRVRKVKRREASKALNLLAVLLRLVRNYETHACNRKKIKKKRRRTCGPHLNQYRYSL